jgi:hypothetical protein
MPRKVKALWGFFFAPGGVADLEQPASALSRYGEVTFGHLFLLVVWSLLFLTGPPPRLRAMAR